MAIEIEYCGAWNYLPDAERVSAEIGAVTAEDVKLIRGGGGIFEIRRNGELLYTKAETGRFPEPGDIPFFNDGSCVHPRSITGLEIEEGKISLIKWQIATKDDGTLQIVRLLLEGPQKLADYQEQ